MLHERNLDLQLETTGVSCLNGGPGGGDRETLFFFVRRSNGSCHAPCTVHTSQARNAVLDWKKGTPPSRSHRSTQSMSQPHLSKRSPRRMHGISDAFVRGCIIFALNVEYDVAGKGLRCIPEQPAYSESWMHSLIREKSYTPKSALRPDLRLSSKKDKAVEHPVILIRCRGRYHFVAQRLVDTLGNGDVEPTGQRWILTTYPSFPQKWKRRDTEEGGAVQGVGGGGHYCSPSQRFLGVTLSRKETGMLRMTKSPSRSCSLQSLS